jgi:hypothetical protein
MEGGEGSFNQINFFISALLAETYERCVIHAP